MTVQNFTFIYAYELYNYYFSESQDEGYEGRYVIVSKVENEEGIHWND
jgi:hypothetical protein